MDSNKYVPIDLRNIAETPQWELLSPDIQESVKVVGEVLPFRTNKYVVEELIDWSNIPADPIFQLVFPQDGMLESEDYQTVKTILDTGDRSALANEVERIRRDLNPHPAGQLTHNIPEDQGQQVQGLQHKYRETVLFFPAPGQTCHAYCTYCFRWAQFVGLQDLKFQTNESSGLVNYLKLHTEVTDVLVTGGDPMIMRTNVLQRYLEPLLEESLEHVQNIRIGTKAVAYWPQRFVSDADADDCLRLFEKIVASGRHLAIMGHYSHPIELESKVSRLAIERIRSTGAQVRMQAPLIKHVNDDPSIWADLWRTGVRLGLIPYYMFVERDTGARKYFEVPLVQCYEIFKEAYSSVSGLARSVRGPSMSAFPGKVRILGVVKLRDITDDNVLELLRETVRFDVLGDPDKPFLVCDFIQARDPSWVRKPFFAEFDEGASWFDDLRPAFGKRQFYFEEQADDVDPYPLFQLTEMLLD